MEQSRVDKRVLNMCLFEVAIEELPGKKIMLPTFKSRSIAQIVLFVPKVFVALMGVWMASSPVGAAGCNLRNTSSRCASRCHRRSACAAFCSQLHPGRKLCCRDGLLSTGHDGLWLAGRRGKELLRSCTGLCSTAGRFRACDFVLRATRLRLKRLRSEPRNGLLPIGGCSCDCLLRPRLLCPCCSAAVSQGVVWWLSAGANRLPVARLRVLKPKALSRRLAAPSANHQSFTDRPYFLDPCVTRPIVGQLLLNLNYRCRFFEFNLRRVLSLSRTSF